MEKSGSCSKLSKSLKISSHYLSNEIRNGKRTVTLQTYRKLCRIAGKSYDGYIKNVLHEDWGRFKGAENSPRTKAKKVERIKHSPELAEMIGIILGDGNIYRKQYALRICGNIKDEEDYLLGHVNGLFHKVFGADLKQYYHRRMNEIILYTYSKFVVSNLEFYGLVSGDKLKNDVRIPSWIMNQRGYIIPCLRGLFDTDGSVFFSKGKLKIELYSAIPGLQHTVERAMRRLGFSSSWKNANKRAQTYGIYSRSDVRMFINTIGFNNPKHKAKCLNCPDGVVV